MGGLKLAVETAAVGPLARQELPGRGYDPFREQTGHAAVVDGAELQLAGAAVDFVAQHPLIPKVHGGVDRVGGTHQDHDRSPQRHGDVSRSSVIGEHQCRAIDQRLEVFEHLAD